MRRCIALLVAVSLALLALASSAPGAVTQLGKPPWKECGGLFQGGVSGCVASEPMAMDDTSVGNVNISPHVIRAGETLTISAEWLPGWAITGFNFPPGEVVSGCGAGEHSCTVKINSTTGGYVRHQLDFCCFNAREQDYYAVTPADEYTIEGTVMDRVGPRQELRPAAFTEVVATIDGEAYPGTTNKMGQYAIQVEQGSGSVRTAQRQCVKDELPKCVTSKAVNVGPNQKVDFEAPPPAKIKGVVKDSEGNPEKGVTIRANDPQGGRLDTSVSDDKGLYELAVRAGAIHLSADDPQACAVSGEQCPKAKDIEVEANDTATQDWRVEGCVKKVDFGTSMVAVNGCFKKVADEEWETEEKFTMDGIPIVPSGKVTLDKQARRIAFGGGVAKLDDQTVFNLASLNFDFPTAETKYSLPFESKVEIGGFELSETMELKFEAGKTTLTTTTKLDTKLGTEATEAKGECKGTAAVVLALTTTNDDLLKSGSFEAKDLQKVFCLPGMSRFSALKLDSIKGSRDFKTKWWSVGGSIIGLPPFKGKFGGAKTSGQITFDPEHWLPQAGELKVSGLDIPLEPPKLYLQNLGVKFGQANKGEATKAEVSLGVSLGPKLGKAVKKSLPVLGEFVIKPEELAALDVTFGGSIAEPTDHQASLEDLVLSAKGTVKFWDQQVFEGTVKLAFASSSLSFTGGMDLKAGNVFALHNDGTAWIDSINGLFFAEGFARAAVPGWAAVSGNFLLNSSLPIAVVCMRDPDGVDFGITYNFKAEAPKLTGCDLSPYRAAKPAGARAAVASKARAGRGGAFTVPRGTKALAIAVDGTGPAGAPVVRIGGPSGAFTTKPAKPSQGKFVRALPSGADGTTYLALSTPRPGRWAVSAQRGSTIRLLRFARPAPEPVVSGKTSGDPCAPTLGWKLKPLPGQTVMIVDQGAAGDTRVIQQAAGAKGSLKVIPPGPGARYLRAIVLQGGGPRETVPLGAYGGPGAPSGLRVQRAKKGLVVSWRAACGVSSYAVGIGEGPQRVVNGTSLTIPKPPKKATVTVTSLVNGAAAGAASRPLLPGTS